MKAIFIGGQGALVDGSGPACTLRCGAAAGLRALAELDFRLIVIDDAPASCAALTTTRRQAESAGPPGQASQAGRRADNGCRRRRIDQVPADALAGAAAASPSAASASASARGRELSATDDGDITAPDYDSLERALDSSDDFEHWCSRVGLSGFGHGKLAGPGKLAVDSRFAGPGKGAGPTPGSALVPGRFSRAWRIAEQHGQRDGYPAERPIADRIADRIADLLFREQLVLHAYYSCRHCAPLSGDKRAPRCFCHAPQPGLLLQAAIEHRIDLVASWLIGATLNEVEAGNRAGCRTVMIDNGSESAWRLGRGRVPTRIAPDLFDSARLIEAEGERR